MKHKHKQPNSSGYITTNKFVSKNFRMKTFLLVSDILPHMSLINICDYFGSSASMVKIPTQLKIVVFFLSYYYGLKT